MSHFSVAVFSRHPGDVEELLAPYNEQTEDEAYLEFEEACESMEDIRARYAQEKQGGESFEAFLRRWYGYDYSEELDAIPTLNGIGGKLAGAGTMNCG